MRRRQDALDARALTVPQPPLTLWLPDLPTRSGATLLVGKGVRVPGQLTEPSSVVVKGSSRLVVTRPNRAGKSTFLAVLAGELDLALVLAARPHAPLRDEPTNHLSITLVDGLTEMLGATRAVVSSHDRQLLRDTEEWSRLELGSAASEPVS